MKPTDAIQQLRKELQKNVDEKTKAGSPRFFKENETVKVYGVKMSVVSKISKEIFKTINEKNKEEVFGVCEELWQSDYLEEAVVACNWAYSFLKKFEPADLKIFEKWVSHYVSNWATCDTLCNHTIGEFLERFPDHLPALKKWAVSDNRWMRRAAAVSLIVPARKGKFLEEIFGIADILLLDQDDLVQKGYGWMLKASSEKHQKAVFDYVVKYKSQMPRTALRYAIEKMPAEMKKKAMEKESKK